MKPPKIEEIIETCESLIDLLEELSKIAQLLKEKIETLKEEAETLKQLKQKQLPNLLEAMENTHDFERLVNHFTTELKTSIKAIERQIETLITDITNHPIHPKDQRKPPNIAAP